MIKIRYTRSKKYRKRYKKFVLGIQVLVIWYAMIIVGVQLNTTTNAAFNDIERVTASLAFNYPHDDGIWEKSSLEEVAAGGTCKDGIYGTFRNKGENVDQELTKYEVYWSETGNPKDGVVVEQGIFPIPNQGETYDIVHTPQKNGNYKFKAYQETGHGNGNGGDGPWSDTITVTDCSVPTLKTDVKEENVKEENLNVKEQPIEEENTTNQSNDSQSDTEVEQNTENQEAPEQESNDSTQTQTGGNTGETNSEETESLNNEESANTKTTTSVENNTENVNQSEQEGEVLEEPKE